METQFIQKNGQAINVISRDLLILPEGGRMKTIAMYEKQLQCSRWTIQTALQHLADAQCLRIETGGQKGSFAFGIDREKLFGYAGWGSMLGLLPFASSLIHHSLFTGIHDALGRSGIPANIAFMTPASKRFEMLSKGQCGFMLTSKLASRLYRESDGDVIEAIELAGCQYCSPYRLYTMRHDIMSIEDGMTVGVYDAAIEQRYITERLCEGKQVVRKVANYQNCQIMLATGEIDVLIQRGDLTDPPQPSCRSYDLADIGVDDEVTKPVIMVNRNDYGIAALLAECIDTGLIAFVQKSVLSGARRYSYL